MTPAGDGERGLVVVPRTPGPLVSLQAGPRDRDDLDELIDELFPDVDEPPGWFDAALLVVGAGLVVAGLIGAVPTLGLVAGLAALGIGCVLPVRVAWRSARRRLQGRRHAALLTTGVAFDTSSPEAARLLGTYRDLVAAAAGTDLEGPAVAAAHGALLDAATLLDGRSPASAAERTYVDERATAIADLAETLRAAEAGELPEPDTLVEARAELDELTRSSSVQWLEALIDEARTHRHGRG